MPAGRDPAALADAARGGDQGALARLLSMVERGGDAAQEVASLTYPAAGETYTLGITGAPGAGKSTLTDRLVGLAKEEAGGDKYAVGVLAVDPSSPFSGGAILGDRVRMPGHALDPRVYIRSMATRGHLGGLAVAVPDAVRLLSAVGIPLVIVETVGVGQQEVEVAGATDTTVVVLNPGWGDAIQASKAGLLEIGDLFAINKADRPGARGDPARSRADARPDRRRRLAPSDRRDRRVHRRRGRRALGGDRGAPDAPPRLRSARGAPAPPADS